MGNFAESDLYKPIYDALIQIGYTVRSEVKDCDIVAKKGEEIKIIELKKAFNIKLVYQAIDRQTICDNVYVAIPRPCRGQKTTAWKNMIRLLKRLNIGLITVALDSEVKIVEVILEPEEHRVTKNKKRYNSLKNEINGRSNEFNVGGVNNKKIITAYREKSIELACILEKREIIYLKELKTIGLNENQPSILYKNFYNWFERVDRGVYKLSDRGKKEIEGFKEITKFYREKWKNF